jgi:hypothetical protein
MYRCSISEATVAKRILDPLGLEARGPPVARAQASPDMFDPGPRYDGADFAFPDQDGPEVGRPSAARTHLVSAAADCSLLGRTQTRSGKAPTVSVSRLVDGCAGALFEVFPVSASRVLKGWREREMKDLARQLGIVTVVARREDGGPGQG